MQHLHGTSAWVVFQSIIAPTEDKKPYKVSGYIREGGENISGTTFNKNFKTDKDEYVSFEVKDGKFLNIKRAEPKEASTETPAAESKEPKVDAPPVVHPGKEEKPAAENKVATQANKPKTLLQLLESDNMKKRFNELLGKKTPGYISSIISATKTNKNLAECEPISIITAGLQAAILGLDINSNLGFAAIVPYKENKKVGIDPNTGKDIWVSKAVAQFQIMKGGYVQLGQRSQQYAAMNVAEVYEGELIVNNRITGEVVIDESKKISDKIIGYCGYFKLIGGFEKYSYWTVKQIEDHGKKYSKSYKTGQWTKDFHSMAMKTALKNMIVKWGPMSTELITAIRADQSVLDEDLNPQYPDNPVEDAEFTEVDDETKALARDAARDKADQLKA